jgi:hypothetical protein
MCLPQVKKNINTSCAVAWVAALAQHGIHFSIIVGHGARVFVSPAELRLIYHASIAELGGAKHSFMMLATKELQEPSDPGLYVPLMEVLRVEAASLGLPPPLFRITAKGPIFTGMTREELGRLSSYKDVVVLAAENSNVRLNEWSLAERASLWLTGSFDHWSGETRAQLTRAQLTKTLAGLTKAPRATHSPQAIPSATICQPIGFRSGQRCATATLCSDSYSRRLRWAPQFFARTTRSPATTRCSCGTPPT